MIFPWLSTDAWAQLAVGAPLLVFVLMMLGLRRQTRLMVFVSFLGAVVAAGACWTLAARTQSSGLYESSVTWFAAGGFTVHFGVRLTGLSTAMAVVVSTVHLVVQIYSVGYMDTDANRGRFFGLLSLFASVMLGLVLAADLVQTFVCWELVGLASYLLIGFWSHKPSAAQAAKKAFVMTRFGDLGLFAGLALLIVELGDLQIDTVLAAVETGRLDSSFVTTVGLLMLCGIAGKSAQFPLHVWLPDAMEGPTPVSSLLHSATMVAAGVYLFALLQPLFLASTVVQTVALTMAIGTALLSAAVAMVERDFKRLLAWSSISQLSFMLMGLAAGSLVGGFFHLVTHAAFKCLLFLSAGIFIHLAHTGDMVSIGRDIGRKADGTAVLGLVIGAACLAGVPGFAGFMSKELVLHALHELGPAFYWLALLGSAMTAYYSARMVLLVLQKPQARSLDAMDDTFGSHYGNVDAAMTSAVFLLTIAALFVGWTGGAVAQHIGLSYDAAHIHWLSSGVGFAVGALLLGLALAWVDFGRTVNDDGQGFLARWPAAHRLVAAGFHVDDFWRQVSDLGVAGLTSVAVFFDRKAVDSSVDAVGAFTKFTGEDVSRMQSGRLQFYVSVGVGALAAIIVWVGVSGS